MQAVPVAAPFLPAVEDVLGDMITWRRAGRRVALVTLVHNDKAAPRQIGAQMAVAEDGRSSGYLSGGCLERAVVADAQDAIRACCNKLVRYGEGSAYIDLKLPCGSTIDLYIDQNLSTGLLDGIADLRSKRAAFWLATDFDNGQSKVVQAGADETPASGRSGSIFRTAVIPRVRVLMVGASPMVRDLAYLTRASGFDISVTSPDETVRSDLAQAGLAAAPLTSAEALGVDHLDRWSAAIVAFHEHDWEAPVLAQILQRPCFYIGVVGSKVAQTNRLQSLSEMGFGAETLARVRGPVGLIPGAKSRSTLAVSVLAELVAEAKSHGMLA